ncbi:hypothetical protein QN277_022171 [Acacia crassicarpa]|uniref:caffeate O-methyltransferase n=1 Tax=Acacia crassicarpa TaxID=499986 RepID=A0AAE1JJ27_9FABA|nr:hypothetical protein QN277_022171 [Acacia crassicarpa]
MARSQESHYSLSNSLHINETLKQQPPKIGDGHEEESFSYAVQLITCSTIPMAMQTVVELGVFDIIHRAGPEARLSAAEIASELSCKNSEAPSALDRILRLLADHSVLHCSVVTDENQQRGCFRRLYGLTPVAKFFLPNVHGGSLAPLLAWSNYQVLLNTWSKMKEAILEGGIAFNRAHGAHIFECMGLDSRLNDSFNETMVNYTTIVMKKILDSYQGFEDITSLVDVGGSLGITLNLITSKYPHIQAINFDLPHVIRRAPPYPGVEHVGGDMFESVPNGDGIMLKWILHDWSDERCLKLLKNCFNAIPKNGKVIVLDAILPIEPDVSATTKSTSQFDVALMASCGGKERSKQEFLNLATSAGFSGIRFQCFVCGLWIMEFFK